MSEKRKPAIKIVAEICGNKHRKTRRLRIELYHQNLWPKKWMFGWRGSRYRVRAEGKWVQGNRVFTLSEVMRQLRMWIFRGGKM
jgi:hypothetical protein